MPRRALLLVLAACGNGVGPPASDTTTSSDTTAGHSETGAGVPTTHAPDSTGATSSEPNDSLSSSGNTFIAPHDLANDGTCDALKQDCPPGEKCTWFSSDGAPWNATKCEPIMEDPAQLNDHCFIVGDPFSGVDNCDLGLMCWGSEAEDYNRCIALCTGNAESVTCMDGYWCQVYSQGQAFCYESCDPLAPTCTRTEDVCLYDSHGSNFFCSRDFSEGKQVHEPCAFTHSCAPGLACVNSTAAMECDPTSQGCCEPLCDTSLPSDCPAQDQMCLPFFAPGEAPPELETLGVCALP